MAKISLGKYQSQALTKKHLEEHNQETLSVENGSINQTEPSVLKYSRHPLVVIAFVVIAVLIMYFVMSPYRNCLRGYALQNTSSGTNMAITRLCGEKTTW
jgi:hypothetical protein